MLRIYYNHSYYYHHYYHYQHYCPHLWESITSIESFHAIIIPRLSPRPKRNRHWECESRIQTYTSLRVYGTTTTEMTWRKASETIWHKASEESPGTKPLKIELDWTVLYLLWDCTLESSAKNRMGSQDPR